MPVITLSLANLRRYAGYKVDEKKIVETLPFLGLDIENREGDLISLEYSPNRPDFSSEAGIARSLVGILGIRIGLPRYNFSKSNYRIIVSRDEIRTSRPFIFGLYAELRVEEPTIKELITMQEDLHNGLGRRRSKVAIGIHNATVIKPPITYRATTDSNYRFVPLGETKEMTISQVLSQTEQGQSYGKLVQSGVYPLLEDSENNLLSMPPIINGDLTKLKPGIDKLFVDVTGTDESACDASLAVIASMLQDIGAKVMSVELKRDSRRLTTPDMRPREAKLEKALIRRTLGIEFSERDIVSSLARSRIGVSKSVRTALIPRYRSDIIHPVDLAEEVALGYGISRFEPMSMETSLAGGLNKKLKKLDEIQEILTGLGLTEVVNFSLTDHERVSGCADPLKVEDAKSQSFEYLRCDLVTTLLSVLGQSTHEEYPQKIYEIAPVFLKSETSKVTSVVEETHLCVLLAEAQSNYSEIHSLLDAFARLALPEGALSLKAITDSTSLFGRGRAASVWFKNKDRPERIGQIGEMAPDALEKFGLKVPACAFELNLEPVLKD